MRISQYCFNCVRSLSGWKANSSVSLFLRKIDHWGGQNIEVVKYTGTCSKSY